MGTPIRARGHPLDRQGGDTESRSQEREVRTPDSRDCANSSFEEGEQSSADAERVGLGRHFCRSIPVDSCAHALRAFESTFPAKKLDEIGTGSRSEEGEKSLHILLLLSDGVAHRRNVQEERDAHRVRNRQ